MDRRIIAVAVVVVIVIIAAVAFLALQNPSPTGTNNGNNSVGTGNSVDISNFAFRPATLTVPLGTTVTWTNNDTTDHTVTFNNGPFTSSGNLGHGQTYAVTFDQAGTFNYHCSIHPSMVAKVIVQ